MTRKINVSNRPKPGKQTIESLMKRTVENGDCLLWTGYMQNHQVPMARHDGKMQSVRKLIAHLNGEDVSANRYWVADCGNKKCVSPEHTKMLKPKEHFKRMAKLLNGNPAKVAIKTSKGNGMRKVTDEQIKEIIHSDESASCLAEKFGVSKETVYRYKNGKHGATLRTNPWIQLLKLGR